MAAPLCGSAGAPAATSPAETPCNKKTFYLLNIFFKWPIHNSHATVRNAHIGITHIHDYTLYNAGTLLSIGTL